MPDARVLHIVGSMDRGGVEAMLMNLHRNIDQWEAQIDFAYFSNRPSGFHSNILEFGGRIFYFGLNTFYMHAFAAQPAKGAP